MDSSASEALAALERIRGSYSAGRNFDLPPVYSAPALWTPGQPLPPPAPGTTRDASGQTRVAGELREAGQLREPGASIGGAGGSMYATTVTITAAQVTIHAASITVNGGSGGTSAGFAGSTAGAGIGAALGGVAAATAGMAGGASAQPVTPPAAPGTGGGGGGSFGGGGVPSGGGNGSGSGGGEPWSGIDDGSGRSYYHPLHQWMRTRFGEQGGDIAFAMYDANIAERAFNSIYQPLFRERQQMINTPYGMTAYDIEAMQMRRNASMISGGLTVGGAIVGGIGAAFMGMPVQAGIAVGGGAGGAAGSFIGGRIEQQANRVQSDSDLIRLKALANWYSAGDFGNEYDSYYKRLIGVQTPDADRRRQEKIALTQSYLSANERLPGSYSFGDVYELERGTVSEKFPEGNPAIYNAQINAGVDAQMRYASLFGMSDSDRRSRLAPEYREAYRLMYAREGDFKGFTEAFGSSPSDITAMRQEFLDSRMRQTSLSIAGSQFSFGQAGITREQARGAGGQQLASMTEAQAMRQGQIAQQLYAEAQALLPADNTPEGRAQFEAAMARAAQAEASAEQMYTQSRRMGYNTRQEGISTALSQSRTGLTRAMFGGGEGDVLGAYDSMATGTVAQANLYRQMSREARFSPEERAHYAAQAEEADTEARYMIPRQSGQFVLGLRQGELGITSAYAQSREQYAGMFGGTGAITSARIANANVVYGGQIGLAQRELGGEFGPRTQQEQLALQERIISLQREQAAAIEQSTRALFSMNVQVAQTSAGIAGTRQQRAFGEGAGGVAGFGYAQASFAGAQGVASAARERVAMLRARGVADDNPEMQSALLAAEQAETSASEAGIARARVPFSIGLRREDSALSYQANILTSVPGSYGNVRGTLQAQSDLFGREEQEIRSRMEAHRRANGGQLSEAEAMEYQEQLQSIGMRQMGVQRQLSEGWQSRLISQTLNTPGSFGMIAPAFSMRSAVRAGVRAPSFGFGSPGDVQDILASSNMLGSIAGATGTPEGFAASAFTGAGMRLDPDAIGAAVGRNLNGVRLVLDVPLPGGGSASVTGTLHAGGGSVGGTSPSGMVENNRLSGSWVVRQ